MIMRKFSLIALLLSAPLALADGEQSAFYGELEAMLHADFVNQSDSHEVVYTHSELEWGMRLGDGFSLNNTLKLEKLEDETRQPPKSSFLDRHILIIEELTVNWDNEKWGFYGGKFYPTVGFIYDEFPGINAHHTVEEYAIHERIGIGVVRRFQAAQLEVATFFADTTFMSDAAFTNRRRLRKEYGGVANSEDFSSLAVSLRGDLPDHGNSPLVEPIYRLGYAYQAGGDSVDGEKGYAESRYSLGLGGNLNLSDDWTLRALGEAIWVKNFAGEKNRRRIYGTISLRLKHDDWHWHAFHAGKFNHPEGGDPNEDENDYLNELSMGYDLTDNWTIDWGYSWLKEEATNSQLINLLLTYEYGWGNDG